MSDWAGASVIACAIGLISLIAFAIIWIPWCVFTKKPISDDSNEPMDDIVFLKGYKKDA
jgi:hypothetical protein